MSAKSDRYYFENLLAAAGCSCEAARHLVACLSDYRAGDLKAMLDAMHEYEHAGDQKKHEMSSSLARAFVTPLDREDLALLSQNIDDVTDSIEEVLQLFYMYGIKNVPEDAVIFARKISECCELMTEMLGEFANFKKPEKLHGLVVDINHMEEECDSLFIESTAMLGERCSDPLEIISWREIYKKMEQCADACEHVGDCVETVVMKNS
ncbi:MAG: DUF47 family protein [Oscillospiraceae bacterium]|nr:DUF47 family protein [Oscillospiraceae bacterium]